MISSLGNTNIKKILKYKRSAKFRRQQGYFIVEGYKMADEALREAKVSEIYVSEGAKEEFYSRFSERIGGIPVEFVSEKVFREISDTETPQGVLALVRIPEYAREELLSGEDVSLVCLEQIQDPGNLGTIFRTAEGAGIKAVVLSRDCVDLFNPKVVRATMGAMFRVPFYVVEDMAKEVERLQQCGFTIYCAQLEASLDYTEIEGIGKVGIVIGNEARGVRKETSRAAGGHVRIPMEGKLESLNAAVSAALLMYEMHRKRK